MFGQEVQVRCSSAAAAAAAAHAAGAAGGGMVEVLQFVRYFHLVPALGLRRAYEAAARKGPGGAAPSFEQLLLAAEAGADGSGGGGAPLARLLRRPQVLALGIVWETPQVRRRSGAS